ncbi:MAG: hypothetical protein IT242_08250 [Bacteroidia bacterium]|nr:hypothetical protein [Bacteroidia bacterium]
MITRSNYEEFFLDYHEGTLSAELTVELFDFLDDNKDLKEEFESFRLLTIDPEPEIRFAGKSLLKKEFIHSGNYKTRFVAFHEGDLTESEMREVMEFIKKHPSLEKEFRLFAVVRIPVESDVKFPDRNSLRKGGIMISMGKRMVVRSLSIAAAIALLILAYNFFFNTGNDAPVMADDSKTTVPEKIYRSPGKTHVPSDATVTPQPRVTTPVHIATQTRHVAASPQHGNKQKKVPHIIPAVEAHMSTVFAPEENLVQVSKKIQVAVDTVQVALHQPPLQKSGVNPEGISSPSMKDLANVFTAQDMEDLGLIPMPEKEKKSLWDMAADGVQKIRAVTGADVSMSKSENVIEESTSYTLAIGNFSFRRSVR